MFRTLRFYHSFFKFLSTPSARRATQDNQQGVLSAVFLSTPSARRATLSIILPSYQFMISIHALREEGDKRSSVLDQSAPVISIHALREEGDLVVLFATRIAPKFLSTPSARRATMPRSTPTSAGAYFYPRPPRGGRQRFQFIIQSDTVFLSTPSARRATSRSSGFVPNAYISIHALREEGDIFIFQLFPAYFNFYPRPPRGGRRMSRSDFINEAVFLSTPSARRATT